jgi:hypothetical protein
MYLVSIAEPFTYKTILPSAPPISSKSHCIVADGAPVVVVVVVLVVVSAGAPVVVLVVDVEVEVDVGAAVVDVDVDVVVGYTITAVPPL